MRPAAREVGQINHFACAEVRSEDDAGEEGKSCFRLVVGDKMSGVVHSAEGQVAVLAHCAADVARIDHNVGVSCRGKSGGIGFGVYT